MGDHRTRWARGASAIALLSLLVACSTSEPRNGSAVAAGASVDDPGFAAAGVLPGTGDAAATADGTIGGSGSAESGVTSTGGRTATAGRSGSGSATSTSGDGDVVRTASAPGVTEDTITVSVIAGFSGPLAAMVTRAYDGIATWQEDTNDAGGIHGRQVVLKKVDHKETADGGVAACKEALSNGSYLALVPEGIEATLTAVGCLDAAGMPTYYYAPTADPSWTRAFATGTTSAQGGHQLASYVANFLKAKDKKVGVIYTNQASYKATVDTFVPEAKRIGLDVAAVEAIEPNQASFTSPLLRMQEKGVEVVVISATLEAIGIMRDARSMGYDALMTGWGFQFDFITGAGRNLFDGVTGLRPYATTDSAAYEQYAARMEARGRARERADDLEGFTAYGYALTLGAVLDAAGPNPTHESVVAGSETFRDFDNGVMGPFSWTADDHVGSHGTFPIVCCNSDYTWKGAGPSRLVY